MGQYWELLNVSAEQTTGHLGKLGEAFFVQRDDLIQLLTAPIDIPPSYFAKPPEWSQKSNSISNPSGPLLTLPLELKQAIAREMIGDYLSLLCLSLSCFAMWEATERARSLSLRKKLSRRSWAGGRLICLGDYAQDLPKGMLNSQSLKIFERRAKKGWERDAEEDESRELTLLKYAVTQWFSRPSQSLEVVGYSDSDRNLYYKVLRVAHTNPAANKWISLEERDFRLKLSSSEDCWMLRNVSKREFVIKSKGKAPYGLEQALFSLICWSSDPSISMSCDDEIAEKLIQGAWAGDMIDVTVLSLHNEQEREIIGLWKDITATVAEMLKALTDEDDEDDDVAILDK